MITLLITLKMMCQQSFHLSVFWGAKIVRIPDVSWKQRASHESVVLFVFTKHCVLWELCGFEPNVGYERSRQNHRQDGACTWDWLWFFVYWATARKRKRRSLLSTARSTINENIMVHDKELFIKSVELNPNVSHQKQYVDEESWQEIIYLHVKK